MKGATVLQDLGYIFDPGGNVTALTDALQGDQIFTYDDLDRLTTGSGIYGTKSYTYDEIGNMLSNCDSGDYTYNASGPASVRPHAVTAAGNNTYDYDANGNMIIGGSGTDDRVITYDYENRPESIIKGSITTTFVYDGDGGRVKKSDGMKTTVYIGKLYVCEDGSCAKNIFAGGKRLALVQVPPGGGPGTTSYFHADHLGSTRVLTDDNGQVEESNIYLPFGQTYLHTGTSDVAYKYTSQELDPTTGLYFYQARYYDAALGRFISPDTIVPSPLNPQSLNRYTYVLNNPLKYTDPTGHSFWGAIKSAARSVGRAISSAWKAVKNVFNSALKFTRGLFRTPAPRRVQTSRIRKPKPDKVQRSNNRGRAGSSNNPFLYRTSGGGTKEQTQPRPYQKSGFEKVKEFASPPFMVLQGRQTFEVEVNAQSLHIEFENVSLVPALAVTDVTIQLGKAPGVPLGQATLDLLVGNPVVFKSDAIFGRTPLKLQVTIDVQNDAVVLGKFFGVRFEKREFPIIRQSP